MKWKMAARPRAHAQGQKHVADLAHGGISQHAFDIPLGERAEPRHQKSGGADHGNRELGRRARGEYSTCVRAIR